jgi:hypothetical protein
MAKVATVSKATVGFAAGAKPDVDNEEREFTDTVRVVVMLVPTAEIDELEVPEGSAVLVNKALNLDNPKANDEFLRTGGVKGSYNIGHASMADADEAITLTAVIDGHSVNAPLTMNLNLSVQGKQVPASVKAATMAANAARIEAVKAKDLTKGK